MDHALKARLAAAKQSLHDKYDALNRAWQEAEEALVSLNVGRDVAVHLYDEDSDWTPPDPPREGWDVPNSLDSQEWSHYLAFTRRASNFREWQICYVSVPVGFDWENLDVGDWRPIRECSKEIRVYAAEELPKLLMAVIEEAEKVAASVGAAAVQVQAAVLPFKG